MKLTKLGKKVLITLLLVILVVMAIPVMRTVPDYCYNIIYMCVVIPSICFSVAALIDTL